MATRSISQRTWRILKELREANGREREKTPEELRAEAQARLYVMDYPTRPVSLSDELAGKIGRG